MILNELARTTVPAVILLENTNVDGLSFCEI